MSPGAGWGSPALCHPRGNRNVLHVLCRRLDGVETQGQGQQDGGWPLRPLRVWSQTSSLLSEPQPPVCKGANSA